MQVKADPLMKVPEGSDAAAEAVHLGQACETGFYGMPFHEMGDKFGIPFRMEEHMRSRTDDGHVAEENVHKLRQFVQAGVPKKMTQRGDPRVIRFSTSHMGLLGIPHRFELDAGEYLIIQAIPQLDKKDALTVCQPVDQPKEGYHPGKHGEHEERGDDHIEPPFKEPVATLEEQTI